MQRIESPIPLSESCKRHNLPQPHGKTRKDGTEQQRKTKEKEGFAKGKGGAVFSYTKEMIPDGEKEHMPAIDVCRVLSSDGCQKAEGKAPGRSGSSGLLKGGCEPGESKNHQKSADHDGMTAKEGRFQECQAAARDKQKDRKLFAFAKGEPFLPRLCERDGESGGSRQRSMGLSCKGHSDCRERKTDKKPVPQHIPGADGKVKRADRVINLQQFAEKQTGEWKDDEKGKELSDESFPAFTRSPGNERQEKEEQRDIDGGKQIPLVVVIIGKVIDHLGGIEGKKANPFAGVKLFQAPVIEGFSRLEIKEKGIKAVNGENLQGQQEKAPKLLAQKRNKLLPGIRFVSGKQVSSMDDKKEGNGEGAKVLKGGAETAGKGAVDQHHKETGDCLAGIRKVVAQG